LSSNLRNKSYFFKNKEYSKDEYTKLTEEYKNISQIKLLEELHIIKNNSAHLCFHGIGNEDCL